MAGAGKRDTRTSRESCENLVRILQELAQSEGSDPLMWNQLILHRDIPDLVPIHLSRVTKFKKLRRKPVVFKNYCIYLLVVGYASRRHLWAFDINTMLAGIY